MQSSAKMARGGQRSNQEQRTHGWGRGSPLKARLHAQNHSAGLQGHLSQGKAGEEQRVPPRPHSLTCPLNPRFPSWAGQRRPTRSRGTSPAPSASPQSCSLPRTRDKPHADERQRAPLQPYRSRALVARRERDHTEVGDGRRSHKRPIERVQGTGNPAASRIRC